MKTAMISAACMALGLGAATAAGAQDGDVGAALYADYCAACHGANALGDGDMANVMTIPSPNLTLLAQANDGEFPMLKVIHIIDGRTGIRAHGGPMPVFGRVFASSEPGPANPYGSVLEVRGRTLSLALYLESLQK
ncbi:cytochrome c [Defluviimonas sp. WL0024]|uniref:Cytochrome c n=2 Tax=Albidovulum TaxID=205889 RepID=A0ABT3J142_9RHOB|nr:MULTISPECIES: cytochrome c [Defluviimonas]MCU9848171.1 cytochrome c [Defluviimonas sp. WL0024]MCW3781399.1 cytochrome c [Defluviimonas salinarum]